MMNRRDVVRTTLDGKTPPYVPWSFRFTQEAAEKLKAHYGAEDLLAATGGHIIELGSDIGFFEPVGNEHYRDVFGVEWDRSVDRDIGVVCNQMLPDPTLAGFRFPDPHDPRFFQDIPEKIARHGDCFRLYCIGFSLFERAWTLRGMETLMMDFFDHPEFVHDLFAALADYNIAQVEKALTYDIDAVYFGDDWGQQHGLMMGYSFWKTFIAPSLERMYRAVRDAGKYVFIHSCGDVDELFPDLVDMGLNCFNPFQPEVMEVDSLMPAYRGRLSFWGGLSTQQTLPYGTVEEVRQATGHLLALGRSGGLILSPAHAVESDVPLENMLAFIDTCRAQGRCAG